jgi:hypothetical protein
VGMFLTTLSFLVTRRASGSRVPAAFPPCRGNRGSSSSRTWPCSGFRSGRWASRGRRACGLRHKSLGN